MEPLWVNNSTTSLMEESLEIDAMITIQDQFVVVTVEPTKIDAMQDKLKLKLPMKENVLIVKSALEKANLFVVMTEKLT